ncbi:MAG: hypothetical protein IT462_10140 [Planctomycetes bacterium]|nr:hypothetical protein [Planctomycetota bacterium]
MKLLHAAIVAAAAGLAAGVRVVDAAPPVIAGVAMSLGSANPAAGPIRRADNPNVLIQIQLKDNTTKGDTVTGVKFSNVGTAVAADWDKFELWHDVDTDGRVDEGLDLLVGTSIGADHTFADVNTDLAPSGNLLLLITCDVSATTSGGGTLRLQITDENIALKANTKPVSSGGVITGNEHVVEAGMASLSLDGGAALPAGNAVRGSINSPILQFTLTAAPIGAPTRFTTITCSGGSGNTAVYADVLRTRAFREGNGPQGVVDAGDRQLGDVGVIDGLFGFRFTCNETISAGETAVILVVADINIGATINNVFRMTIDQAGIGAVATWSGGIAAFTEDPRTIRNPLARSLAIIAPPQDAAAGNLLATVAVEALKADGSRDLTFNNAVTVELELAPQDAVFHAGSTTAVLAIAGVATFNNLMLTMAGDYQLRFVSPPLPTTPSAISAKFTIHPGDPRQFAIAAQPRDGVVGAPLPPPPVVRALDLYGNVATSYGGNVAATLIVNPGGAVLSGFTVQAQDGVATFDALFLNRPGIGYRLRFSDGVLLDTDYSDAFSIDLGAPWALAVIQQPVDSNGGEAMSPGPRVRVVDAGGNTLVAYTADVTVAIENNPVGAVLSGTTAVAPAAGDAGFPSLVIDRAAAGYTLRFSSGALTVVSASFAVHVGPGARLAIINQPSDSTGGVALSGQPVVAMHDRGGNVVTSDSTTVLVAAVTPGSGVPGATLAGTTAMILSGGVAAFSDLAIDKAGQYTLDFSAAGVAPATSASITIGVGSAAKLAITIQPGGAFWGAAFMQQPAVEVHDLGGNLTASAATIVARLDAATGTVGAVLQGTTALSAAKGVVMFAQLAIDKPGLGFVLIFESAGLVAAVAEPLDVASDATQLGLATQPGQGVLDAVLSVQPVVEIRDANGVVVVVDNYSIVTAEVVAPPGAPGAMLAGATSVPAINGVAAFTNLKVATPGLGYYLRFSCNSGLAPAHSTAFNVAGLAIKARLARQPAGAMAGECLRVQPRIEIVDANDVLVLNDNTTTVMAFITPGTGASHASLGGATLVTATGGVVEFTDLAIDRPGAGYSLTFATTPMLRQLPTAAFDIGGAVSASGTAPITAPLDGGSCSTGGVTAPVFLVVLLALLRLGAFPRRKSSL